MNDLVTRLRAMATGGWHHLPNAKTAGEAADTIERLIAERDAEHDRAERCIAVAEKLSALADDLIDKREAAIERIERVLSGTIPPKPEPPPLRDVRDGERPRPSPFVMLPWCGR